MSRTVSLHRVLAGATVILGTVVSGPAALHANCIPVAGAGDYVPFTMTTLFTSGVASYANGTLFNSYTTKYYIISGTQQPQLFSDRFVPCGTDCFSTQPFDIGQADQLGVEIATTRSTLSGPNPNVTLTFTLESWGNGQFSLKGHCDAVTGLLYGSGSWPPNTDNAMVTIRFGTPYAIQ
jgi:hypothetical protein